jgi:hypothetical protein
MTTRASGNGDQISIGGVQVSAHDVAQVLGKTGNFLGRLIARVKLAYELNMVVSRASMGKLLEGMDLATLQAIDRAYQQQIGGSKQQRTPQMVELSQRKVLPMTGKPFPGWPLAAMTLVNVIRSLFDTTVSSPFQGVVGRDSAPPAKNVIPWDIAMTVSISLMMLDPSLSDGDRQRALQLKGRAGGFPPELHMPFVKQEKTPHNPLQGLTIGIPKDRPGIVEALRVRGFEVHDATGSYAQAYPWTCSLNREQLDDLLSQLDIPLSTIHYAPPTPIQLNQLHVPHGAEGLERGVGRKAVILPEVADDPSMTKETVMGFFDHCLAGSPQKGAILQRLSAFWDESLPDQADGPKARAILRYLTKQLSAKPALVPSDRKVLADVDEALKGGCFVAKYTRLSVDFDGWRGAQQAGTDTGVSDFERAILSTVAGFKDAIVIGISQPAPQSVHLVSYLEQRWATLFGFNAQPDHAAYQGPSSLAQISLTEEEAAQEFLSRYCEIDPSSPYPNKTALFRAVYENMLAMKFGDQDIWNNPLFGQQLLRLVENDQDVMGYLLCFNAADVPTGLRPEGAELILMSMGLLPGDVSAKLAEIRAQMSGAVAPPPSHVSIHPGPFPSPAPHDIRTMSDGAAAVQEAASRWAPPGASGSGTFLNNQRLVRELIENPHVSPQQLYSFLVSKDVKAIGRLLGAPMEGGEALAGVLQRVRGVTPQQLYATYALPPSGPSGPIIGPFASPLPHSDPQLASQVAPLCARIREGAQRLQQAISTTPLPSLYLAAVVQRSQDDLEALSILDNGTPHSMEFLEAENAVHAMQQQLQSVAYRALQEAQGELAASRFPEQFAGSMFQQNPQGQPIMGQDGKPVQKDELQLNAQLWGNIAVHFRLISQNVALSQQEAAQALQFLTWYQGGTAFASLIGPSGKLAFYKPYFDAIRTRLEAVAAGASSPPAVMPFHSDTFVPTTVIADHSTLPPEVARAFTGVRSDSLHVVPGLTPQYVGEWQQWNVEHKRNQCDYRQLWQQVVQKDSTKRPPVLTSIPEGMDVEMARHLLCDKKFVALGQKFQTFEEKVASGSFEAVGRSDRITDAEAVLALGLVSHVPVEIGITYKYLHGHGGHRTFPIGAPGQFASVVISTKMSPDCELGGKNQVATRFRAGQNPRVGRPLSQSFPFGRPTDEALENPGLRAAYDDAVVSDMLLRTMPGFTIPAARDIPPANIIDESSAAAFRAAVQRCASDPNPAQALQRVIAGKYIKLPDGGLMSLEVLYTLSAMGVKGECALMNGYTQGAVLTIDPAAIFAKQLGGPSSEAGKMIGVFEGFAMRAAWDAGNGRTVRGIAINDFADPGLVPLYQALFPPVPQGGTPVIMRKDHLFGPEGQFIAAGTTPQGQGYNFSGCALILHPNVDPFGENYAHESMPHNEDRPDDVSGSSLDPAITGSTNFCEAMVAGRNPSIVQYMLRV